MSKPLSVLALTYDGEYYNKRGALTYRYVVTGDKHSLQAYQEHDERVVVDENNRTLFFTSTELGDGATLRPNEDGSRWYSKAGMLMSVLTSRIDAMLRKSGFGNLMGSLGGQSTAVVEEEEDDHIPAATSATKTPVTAGDEEIG